jgi:hypothetical protein
VAVAAQLDRPQTPAGLCLIRAVRGYACLSRPGEGGGGK